MDQEFEEASPAFEIVEICPDLTNESPSEWRDLGNGFAFGSRQHPTAVWMEVSAIDKVPISVQRDILIFDWWVRNCDRQLGNTNLLIDAPSNEIVVIDHNLAFDKNFVVEDFTTQHVFSAQWGDICSDLIAQAEYSDRLLKALEVLTVACHNVPEEWHWSNVEMDLPANFDMDYVHRTLNRCATVELWRTV